MEENLGKGAEEPEGARVSGTSGPFATPALEPKGPPVNES